MTKSKETKNLWLGLNAFFAANYSLYILLFIIRIPLAPLPGVVNTLSLIISYSLGLKMSYKGISDAISQSNFYCLIVLITFPNQILLMPFYLLSIYHLSSYVLSNRKIFEKTAVYTMCLAVATYHVQLGRLALILEILCVPVSFGLILFGYSNFATFTAYSAMVRQQYLTNPTMRSVFGEVRVCLDNWTKLCPPVIQDYYIRGRDFLMSYHTIQK